MAGLGIARGEERRRQVELKPVVALELLVDAGGEGGFGVEPAHFIFILVGQQLRIVAGDGFGEAGLAGLRFDRLHAFDESGVTLRKGCVLIRGQVLYAAGHDLVERARQAVEGHDVVGRRHQSLDGSAIVRGAAAPAEGTEIHLDGSAVQLDRLLERFEADRDQALLPGIAQHEEVGGDRIAHQAGGDVRRVEEVAGIRAGRRFDRELQRVGREGEIGMTREFAGDGLVRVDDGAAVAGLELAERSGAGADDKIAAQQDVRATGGEPHRVQRFRRGADAHVAHDGAALLRHAELVEHGCALAFDVRGHAHEGADGHDTRAADAGDEHAVGLVGDRRQEGKRRQRQLGGGLLVDLALAQAAAFDGDEGRAETVQAGEVLVAGRLVDGTLGAELGLDRRDRQAVRRHGTVAAAFADRLVDEHALGGIGEGAALPAAALLCSAGLIVDQDRDALHLAQLALHLVELVAVMEGDTRRPLRADRIFARLVGHQCDAARAFGINLLADRPGMDVAIMRLTAGHGDGVVVEDLVGDGGVGGDRLANREIAGVEVGAVTQVLEDVRHVGEVRSADPRHALGAHVGEGLGVALHADRQGVATDAGQRHRAVRHLGRGVVRTAGTEVGDARHARVVAHLARRALAQHVEPALGGFTERVEAEARHDRRGDLDGR